MHDVILKLLSIQVDTACSNKMRVWIVLLLCVMASTAAEHHTYKDFSALFTATLDQTFDKPGISGFAQADPEFTFFKRYMQFRDEAIQHATDDVIRFFNESYGLDFSSSVPNEQNERFFENARMYPHIIPPDTINYIVTSNNWIRSGSTRSVSYLMRVGGFLVNFSSDQTLRGSYGGTEGKPAGPAVSLVYGFYNIDVCPQSPVIIQFQSGTPFRAEPVDGHYIINFELYSTVLGRGAAQGIISSTQISENPSLYRVVIRLPFTFPEP